MPTKPLVTSYAQDQKLFPDVWHKIALTFGVIFCAAFPFMADSYWLAIGNTALIAVVGSVGMMILTGFAGQISLGHAAFLALGAYTTAITSGSLGLPFWLAMPLSGLVATAVGLMIGPFALRLRGLYLAIVTLGLLFLVNHLLMSFPELTGGSSGLSVPMHSWFPAEGQDTPFGTFGGALDLGFIQIAWEQKLYFVFLAVATIAALASKNIQRSNIGRAMVSVRDHDLAAAALGVNPAKTKVIAFGISSFFAGVAGSMLAYQQQFITIDPPFNLQMSVEYIAMIVLGGIGTTFGAIAGAIAFVILGPIAELFGELGFVQEYLSFFADLSGSQQSTLLFSLLVIGFLVFEPLGLFGLWQRIKRYFVAWPFKY
ncbi:MAG: branched-chain amino acid ABC transporter permease [Myxococcota bacterium]